MLPDGASAKMRVGAHLSWRDLPALGGTLAIGAVGGTAFNYFQLPLAWMLGSICATTPLAMAGVPLRMDARLRMAMIVVLGMMIGGTFSPEVVAGAGRWWVSMAWMAVLIGLISMVVYYGFTRLAGFDRRTAIFSCLPGGLNEMAILGAAMGADDRLISLVHSVRIFLVVMTVPFVFQALGWYERGASGAAVVPLAGFEFIQFAKVVLGSFAGMAVCRLLRFPSPILIGTMLGSASIYVTGLTDVKLPTVLIIIAQIIIGSAIGTRFAGLRGRVVWRGMRHAVGSTFFMIAAAFGATAIIAPATGFAFAPMLLAFAPGGFAEMSLIALALNIDTAYVSTHHIFRIFLIVLLMPICFRLLVRAGLLGPPKQSPPRGDGS